MKIKLFTVLTFAVILLMACGSTAVPISKQVRSIPAPIPAQLAPAPAVLGDKVGITISGFRFDPAAISVSVGTTVTWTNKDASNHTIFAEDGSWKSEDLAKDAAFSFTFDKAGTYTYICGIYPTMKGTIIVK